MYYHTETIYSNNMCSLDPKAPLLANTCLVKRAETTSSLVLAPKLNHSSFLRARRSQLELGWLLPLNLQRQVRTAQALRKPLFSWLHLAEPATWMLPESLKSHSKEQKLSHTLCIPSLRPGLVSPRQRCSHSLTTMAALQHLMRKSEVKFNHPFVTISRTRCFTAGRDGTSTYPALGNKAAPSTNQQVASSLLTNFQPSFIIYNKERC